MSDSMREHRNAIFICITICILSFGFVICISFDIVAFLATLLDRINMYFVENTKITKMIYDISLGVFSSAFVVLLTFLGAYRIDKRKVIGKLKYYCTEYIALLPLLQHELLNDDDKTKYIMGEVIEKIRSNEKVHDIVIQLLRIHDERLLNVAGYYPFLCKVNINLDVKELICLFAEFNCAIQYFDFAYKQNRNIIYAHMTRSLNYSSDGLISNINIVIENESNLYKKFVDLLNKVEEKYPSKSVRNSSCKR